jgi:hypothetical protein
VQAFAAVQDTPSRELRVAPGGLGVVCTVQLVPSQCSASVATPPPDRTLPTAVHDVAAVQDTAARLLAPELGVGSAVQVWPFHTSASGSKRLPLISVLPTATQALKAVQDTLSRLPATAPDGNAGLWSCHLSDQSSTSA